MVMYGIHNASGCELPSMYFNDISLTYSRPLMISGYCTEDL